MDIPARPEKIYKGRGWIGVGDWLGYRGRFSGARYKSKKIRAARTVSRHLFIKAKESANG